MKKIDELPSLIREKLIGELTIDRILSALAQKDAISADVCVDVRDPTTKKIKTCNLSLFEPNKTILSFNYYIPDLGRSHALKLIELRSITFNYFECIELLSELTNKLEE